MVHLDLSDCPNGGLAGGQVAGGLSIPTAGPLSSSSGSRVLTAARGPDGIISTDAAHRLISLAAAAVIPRLTDSVPVFAGVRNSVGGSMRRSPDDDIWLCFCADAGMIARLRAGMRSGMHSGAGMRSGMHSGAGMRSGMHSGAGMRSGLHSGAGMHSGMHSGAEMHSGMRAGAGMHSGTEMHSGAGMRSGLHSGAGMRSGMYSGAGMHSGREMHSGAGLCSEADGGVISSW